MASQIKFLEPILKTNSLFLAQKDSLLEPTESKIIQGNSLAEVPSYQTLSSQPLGALLGQDFPEDRKEIIEYAVQTGDTLSSICQNFNISLNTLLLANSLNKNSKIQVGDRLIILPVDGVVYHVKSGDTVSDIAKTYKGKVEEIVAFNELSNEVDVYIGDILIIPNGTMPQTPSYIAQTPLANSYFIFPTQGEISQVLHWYNAVDIGNKCGTPIFAAAPGQVLKVKTTASTSKWALQGLGNHITILHPNGVVTYYGHILTTFVNPGDEVYQGQKIALMGGEPGTQGAGYSTGCHLHFGVSGAKNPLANYLLGAEIKY